MLLVSPASGLHHWAPELTILQNDEVPERTIYTLAAVEGLRQQLLSGRGIFCPYCSGRPDYKCHPEWREMLSRLSSLALAGRFGPGDWSPLSYRNHRHASM
jgi:hypothetical protein